MIHYDICLLCGEATPTPESWDAHRREVHVRDDEPCEICGEWDDERTVFTEFGWAHFGCATQKGYELAQEHMERAG